YLMVAEKPAVRLSDLLPMFTHSELFAKAAVQSRCSPMPKALRKPELLQLICGNLRDQGESSERWYSLLELDMPVLQPAHIDVLERFRLLFFGHLGQDLTEFVLADLGLVQYENYPLEGTAAAFKHRWELDELLVAIQIRTQVEEMLEKWDAPCVADQIFSEGACSSLNFSAFAPAQRQIAKAYNRLGRELERQNFLEQAASFYRLSNQPPARERLARVLCAQKDYETAIALCDQILA